MLHIHYVVDACQNDMPWLVATVVDSKWTYTCSKHMGIHTIVCVAFPRLEWPQRAIDGRTTKIVTHGKAGSPYGGTLKFI